ncbi:MAG: hypothetical protein ACKO5F_13425 [Synechococcus sp.]
MNGSSLFGKAHIRIRRHRIHLGALSVSAAVGLFSLSAEPARAVESMEQTIERYSQYILAIWKLDPQLSQVPPPQIISSISANTKVFGGCAAVISDHLRFEVGGTSYCPATNTIFVVVDQLRPFYEAYGPAAIGYALAHEYGHYIQAKFQIQSDTVHLELQADCLAGSILGQNPEATGVRQPEIPLIAQTAYKLGSASHGTGDQRAFAVYTGLGQSGELTCKLEDMVKLAKNQVKDPRFGSIDSLRSGNGRGVSFAAKGPYLRGVSASLGL